MQRIDVLLYLDGDQVAELDRQVAEFNARSAGQPDIAGKPRPAITRERWLAVLAQDGLRQRHQRHLDELAEADQVEAELLDQVELAQVADGTFDGQLATTVQLVHVRRQRRDQGLDRY